jgi:hypothetical protein
MFNKISIAASFITVITFSHCSIARADYVNDAIRQANGVASQAEYYNRNVLIPQVAAQERYINQLQSLCARGNYQACRASSVLIRRQSNQYNSHLQRQRQRLRY